MYDPVETDISKKFLLRIIEKFESENLGLMGGWAVYMHANENFMKATGKEYLRSRDIDVFINCERRFLEKFRKIIFEMGFIPSGYSFRYQLIIDRNALKPISEDGAKRKPAFELIYVFLDVFGNEKNDILQVWETDAVKEIIKKKATITREIGGKYVNIPKRENLLAMKFESFMQRDNKEKAMKDACDIYALLFYSDMKKSPKLPEKVLEKLLSESVLEFIAEELFGDRYKSGLVKRNLQNIAKLE